MSDVIPAQKQEYPSTACRLANDKQLNAVAGVTLVDAKPYFDCNIWNLRGAVDPATAPQLVWDHALKTTATLRVGVVQRVEGNTVVLADGSVVPFDHLVVATGASWPSSVLKATEPTKVRLLCLPQAIRLTGVRRLVAWLLPRRILIRVLRVASAERLRSLRSMYPDQPRRC